MRYKVIFSAAMAIALTLAVSGQSSKAESLLGSGLHQEEVEGNCKEAIKTYQKVIQDRNAPRHIAALAQLHIGACQEKLGQSEARVTYELVLAQYGDQTELVAAARGRLTSIGRALQPDQLTARHVYSRDYSGNGESITPDGHFIVGGDNRNGDVVVRDTATGQVRRLIETRQAIPEPTWAESPILSPDQKWVAYLWFDDSDTHQLRLMPNEIGGKHRVLLGDSTRFRNPYPAAWSPDGKSILVSIEKPVDSRTNPSQPAGRGDFDLAWVSTSDSSIKVIKSLEWWRSDSPSLNCIELSLSPDGRYIAYSARARVRGTDSYIFIMSADGTGETIVTKTAGINESPIWSPDSSNLLFVSDRSGTFGLWSLPVRDGNVAGNPQIVKADIGRITPIGMTNSGSFYYTQKSADQMISIVEMQSNSMRVLRPGGIPTESHVGIRSKWSPDGKAIAFVRKSRTVAGTFDLVVQSLETREERVYSRAGMSSTCPPGWFNDGKAVLQVARQQDGTTRLYRIDLQNGEFKEVLSFGSTFSCIGMDLSLDDKTLYVPGRNPQDSGRVDRILTFELSTGQQRILYTLPAGTIAGFQRSPDGREFWIRSNDKESKLAVVLIDGSGYRELLSGALNSITDFHWVPNGKAIVFAKQNDSDGSKSRIMAISVAGGVPEFSGLEVQNLPQGGMDLSPDGSQLAVSSARTLYDIWALDNLERSLNTR